VPMREQCFGILGNLLFYLALSPHAEGESISLTTCGTSMEKDVKQLSEGATAVVPKTPINCLAPLELDKMHLGTPL
jgi:2-keto-4-pentenoate hydratase